LQAIVVTQLNPPGVARGLRKSSFRLERSKATLGHSRRVAPGLHFPARMSSPLRSRCVRVRHTRRHITTRPGLPHAQAEKVRIGQEDADIGKYAM